MARAAHQDACSPRTPLLHHCPHARHVPCMCRDARAPAASRGVSLRRWRVRGHPVRGARRRRSATVPRVRCPRYSTLVRLFARAILLVRSVLLQVQSNQYMPHGMIVYLAWRCAQTELGVHLGDAQPGADELREEARIDRRLGRRRGRAARLRAAALTARIAAVASPVRTIDAAATTPRSADPALRASASAGYGRCGCCACGLGL